MKKVICWWSGGITSAVACKVAIDLYGKENCRVILLDTGNEHKDTYRFMLDCQNWYGIEVEILKSTDYKNIQETWYKHLSLNTATGAICSYMLKRRVREKWEKENEYSYQVFGFEYNKRELKRARSLKLNHPHTNPIFPLLKKKYNKQKCIELVNAQNIKVPEAYKLGFQNNNCLGPDDDKPGAIGGCVQGGIGYWKLFKELYPHKFDSMAKVEHDLTDLKGSPVTMLKDQSNKAKQSGVQLVFLKKHKDYPQHKSIDEMRGRSVRPLQECNGFCGTNDFLPNNPTENEINWQESE